jgi:hypothetical protein
LSSRIGYVTLGPWKTGIFDYSNNALATASWVAALPDGLNVANQVLIPTGRVLSPEIHAGVTTRLVRVYLGSDGLHTRVGYIDPLSGAFETLNLGDILNDAYNPSRPLPLGTVFASNINAADYNIYSVGRLVASSATIGALEIDNIGFTDLGVSSLLASVVGAQVITTSSIAGIRTLTLSSMSVAGQIAADSLYATGGLSTTLLAISTIHGNTALYFPSIFISNAILSNLAVSNLTIANAINGPNADLNILTILASSVTADGMATGSLTVDAFADIFQLNVSSLFASAALAGSLGVSSLAVSTITAISAITAPSVLARHMDVSVAAISTINVNTIAAAGSIAVPAINIATLHGSTATVSTIHTSVINVSLANVLTGSLRDVHASIATISTINTSTLNVSGATVLSALTAPLISAAAFTGSYLEVPHITTLNVSVMNNLAVQNAVTAANVYAGAVLGEELVETSVLTASVLSANILYGSALDVLDIRTLNMSVLNDLAVQNAVTAANVYTVAMTADETVTTSALILCKGETQFMLSVGGSNELTFNGAAVGGGGSSLLPYSVLQMSTAYMRMGEELSAMLVFVSTDTMNVSCVVLPDVTTIPEGSYYQLLPVAGGVTFGVKASPDELSTTLTTLSNTTPTTFVAVPTAIAMPPGNGGWKYYTG